MIENTFLSELDDLDIFETKKILKKNDSNPNHLKVVAEKKPKSRGGYRPVLVDNEQILVEESEHLKDKMEILKNTHMSDQDKVSFYMIVYLNQRYPNQMFESYKPIINSHNVNSIEFSEIIKFKNKNIIKRLQKLNLKTLFDLVNSFDMHSVPYSARYTLINWYMNGKFKLILFENGMPSGLDVLKMQAKGQRCVSLIYNQLDRLVANERDPLSFLLHDLVHAYKMFNNDYLLTGQIGFCRAILKIFNNTNGEEILNNLSQSDEAFSEEFDYLISDMNSHPRHLFYYFKAILIIYFKKKYKLEKSEQLSGDSLSEFNNCFELFLDLFEMSEGEKDLSRKLLVDENSNIKNATKLSQTLDFTLLDNYFLNLGNENITE